MDIERIEAQRLVLQAALDGQKTQSERNKLGQFATPTALAREVVQAGLMYLPPGEAVRFLDPAIGTGSFYSALLATAGPRAIADAHGYELDAHYGAPSREFWAAHGVQVLSADFTAEVPRPAYNLVVCNPPYVRHHHLAKDYKERLGSLSSELAGCKVSGLSGLYVHFMLLATRWMEPGGIGVWLVPSEFMDVNYGKCIKRFLRERVTLIRVHRSDPKEVQFEDALVSSAVVIFKNARPSDEHRALFTFGGTVAAPVVSSSVGLPALEASPKWTRFPAEVERAQQKAGTRLGDIFEVKRGIATGDNNFFILSETRLRELGIPSVLSRPILPSPRQVKVTTVLADEKGVPTNVERLFLLNCSLPEEEIETKYPALHKYLSSGREMVAAGYLCSKRRPWYSQEQRDPAPIMCTYMGRGDPSKIRPFRFIRNRSMAIGANVYLLLYPRRGVAVSDQFLDAIWFHLEQLDPATLMREGRVYGGGLHKLEPAELAEVPLPDELAREALTPTFYRRTP